MNNRRAFTLLELLLATVLSVLLMMGVLGVITSIGSPDRPGENTGAPAQQQAEMVQSLIRLLGDDLRQAHLVEHEQDNVLLLTGPIGLSDGERSRLHRQVRVEYRIERVEDRPWLTRRQTELDVLTSDNLQRDLVCSGIERFQIEQFFPYQPEGEEATELPVQSLEDELLPIQFNGGLWRLSVWFGTQEQADVNRLLAIDLGAKP